MITPIWTAIAIGLVFVGLRLFQRDAAHSPKWLRAVTPDVPLGWTIAAAIIGIGVIAVLDATGMFRQTVDAPETPILIVAAVLVLQVAVLLSVVAIRRRQGRGEPPLTGLR